LQHPSKSTACKAGACDLPTLPRALGAPKGSHNLPRGTAGIHGAQHAVGLVSGLSHSRAPGTPGQGTGALSRAPRPQHQPRCWQPHGTNGLRGSRGHRFLFRACTDRHWHGVQHGSVAACPRSSSSHPAPRQGPCEALGTSRTPLDSPLLQGMSMSGMPTASTAGRNGIARRLQVSQRSLAAATLFS